MDISQFCDGKTKQEEMDGFPVEGDVVRRCDGMIYWYRWGKHTFDIRVMRRVVGLPEDNEEYDAFFVPDNHLTSQEALVSSMRQVLSNGGKKNFREHIKEHDVINKKFVKNDSAKPF